MVPSMQTQRKPGHDLNFLWPEAAEAVAAEVDAGPTIAAMLVCCCVARDGGGGGI